MRRRGRGVAPAWLSTLLLCTSTLALWPAAARAGDATRFDASGFELRLGTFAHDALSPERGGVDINAEVLAAPFRSSSAQSWWMPRVHAGSTINTMGKTSSLYAGLTWTFDLTQNLFAEASFGGAVHNGAVGRIVLPGHNAMGCRAVFRESASLGYRFTSHFAIMGTVEHLSNAGLCSRNRGLTNFGLRAAWSF